MKTLKNIFGIKKSKKSMNSFSNKLDFNAMLMVKGGDGDDEEDYWPPTTSTGSNQFALTLIFIYAFN